MSHQRRNLNMYVTTTLSITLVLILVGLEAIALLASRHFVKQVKENVAIEIILNDAADKSDLERLYRVLDNSRFCKEYTTITKEQALEEYIKFLGEDPTEFLDYNPLHESIVLYLNEDYTQTDSIAIIEHRLRNFTSIQKIEYPQDIVSILNRNISYLSLVLLAIAAVLLIIAIALISNTIRLAIYSKRFLIHTMKLVGATSWFIKRPIIGRGLLMGLIATVLTCAVLYGGLWYTQRELNILLFADTWQNYAFIAGIITGLALIITYFSSAFATNKYLRKKVNELYYM